MMYVRFAGRLCDRRQLKTVVPDEPVVIALGPGNRTTLGPLWNQGILHNTCSLLGTSGAVVIEHTSSMPGVNKTETTAGRQLVAGDHFEIDGALFFVHAAPPPDPSWSLDVWLERLRSGNDDTRWTAAQVLSTWAPRRDEVRVAFDEACADSFAPVVRYATDGLHHARRGSFYLRATSDMVDRTAYSAIEIRPEESRTLGRHVTNDVVVFNPTVSQQHAVVHNQPTGWALEDRGSTSGCIVDHQRCSGSNPVPLTVGSKLRIGGVEFVVDEAPREALRISV